MKITQEQAEILFEKIIDEIDRIRFGSKGGYPSQTGVVGDCFVQATVDHDGAPLLNTWRIQEVVEELEGLLVGKATLRLLLGKDSLRNVFAESDRDYEEFLYILM